MAEFENEHKIPARTLDRSLKRHSKETRNGTEKGQPRSSQEPLVDYITPALYREPITQSV